MGIETAKEEYGVVLDPTIFKTDTGPTAKLVTENCS